ncbi:MAG TPA: type II toxin-antitoxin system MqsA family antitoxin [Candidatus Margulisiibacteriota bacterium]|nr:type II toxin-antitoxin system MqsA family antitoxin [Candidatus Margulisiibacteriota bacterium]
MGCRGRLRPDAITRVFRRAGSRVEVIVENIPADVCPACGRAYFSEPVARDIDRLLAAFHGTRAAIPRLPPARVMVDFVAARKKVAA